MTLSGLAARRLDALAPAGARCLLAVSGGPDSMALLDLLWEGRAIHGREMVIGHVEHGIHPASVAGLQAIEAWLAARQLDEAELPSADDASPLPQLLVATLALGVGTTETRARDARHQALSSLALAVGAGCIVFAHHASDQAETVLLRLLRGSGPAGLAGMAPRRGIWIRPLLEVSAEQLRHHLMARQIEFWNDPANSDPANLRSWLRSTVLPLMEARLPDLPERLLTASRHAATARQAWKDVASQLADLSLQQEKDGISVAATALSGYSSELRTALIGTLGRRLGVSLGERRIRTVEQLLATGQGRADLDAKLQVELAFGRLSLRHRGGPLAPQVPLHDGVEWGDHCFSLRPGRVTPVSRRGWSTWLAPGAYQIRGWRPGDKIWPIGGKGSRAIGVMLKEAKVPPSQRPSWPVVTGQDGATILWVPGICRSAEDVPQEETLAIHVDCAGC